MDRKRLTFYVSKHTYERFHALFPESNAKSLVLQQLVGMCIMLGKGHKFIDKMREMIERKYECS